MRAPKLCLTITAATMAELRARRDQVADADLIELRVDTVADPSAAGAIEGRRRPVIVTCRPAWQGGGFHGSEEERRRLLGEAQQLGADYVDVEWKAGFGGIVERNGGRGIVLSHHDFDGIPTDLATSTAAMRGTGAEIVKVAVMARRLSDCLPLLAITKDHEASTVAIAMGDPGLATRILAGRFGSCWTYAGQGAAPGQMTASRLLQEFSFSRLGERTAVYGVVGRPVMHSVSPAMHNAAFRAAGVDAVYLPLAAADFDDFLQFAAALGLAGASVTAPFKLAAYDRAIDRDVMSQRVQSVNTLKSSGEGWAGCNTDVTGLLAPLKDVRLEGQRATILGAGGASRAASVALRSAGARVTIAARRADRAHVVAGLTGAGVASWPPPAGSWDVLVNATPAGTSPDIAESPLPDGPFTGHLVYDLVYNPPDTRLLRDARAAGCRTIGGLAMLVGQAERQFEWWTGAPPVQHVMRDAAIDALGQSERKAPESPGAVGSYETDHL